MDFLDLPAELIQYVCSFMTAESLSCLSQTCKQLNKITKIDSMWQALSYQDYQVSSNKGWNLSYRDIYTKVLHKLPGILGLKRLGIVPYGGLVNVCWAEGKIQVTRYLPHEETIYLGQLFCQPLFILQWNESLQDIQVLCDECASGTRPAILAQAGKYPLLQCADTDCYNDHIMKANIWISIHSDDQGYDTVLSNEVLRFGQSDRRFDCLFDKFDEHPDVFRNFNLDKGFNCPLLPVAIPTSADQARSPIPLGLYIMSYLSDGMQVVNLMISQTNPLHLEGFKISGDANVPAGNISFTVFLDKPVVLSEGDQESIPEILNADEQRTEESFAELLNVISNNPDLQQQPFIIPEDCSVKFPGAPNTCMARYSISGEDVRSVYNQRTTGAISIHPYPSPVGERGCTY